MVDLNGDRVIITGAGRGLGRAYALAAAGAGGKVVVNDRDVAEARAVAAEIVRAGGVAVASRHAVDQPGEARGLVDLAVAELGGLDGLVLNAGLYHEALPWQEDVDLADRDVRVNVLGAINCLTAASAVMVEAGRGSIVVASSAGLLGSRRIMTYAATKGAVASLAFASALDLAEHGVRVNAIAPVAITRMTRGAVGRRVVPVGAGQALLAGVEQRAPERVAPLVTYLLSDAARGVTGQLIRFDGNRLAVFSQQAVADLPGLSADSWTTDSIAAAFGGPLAGALSPFGVERMPADAAASHPR
ncbi:MULTISPECIES: SDR family NAD(P)-dependent oxidoreductase [unclassified Nocardioides]|uniref:SDR family NAD(P)-dependent oxidoreductase n=1 Tax=unclassified Nocardioides TaxID=2615069 RepID=UPI0036177F7E